MTRLLAARHATSFFQLTTALTARYLAGFMRMFRRGAEHSGLAATDDSIRHRDGYRYSSVSGAPLRQTDYTSGGIFDPLFRGLSADAGLAPAGEIERKSF
jgi:hypothetical protein